MKVRGVALLAFVVGLAVFAWPSPIQPVAWDPPPVRSLDVDTRPLGVVSALSVGEAIGAEDVAVDADGAVYTGVADGRILRFAPGSSAPEEWANTGGRPLGLDFDPDGWLIVADAIQGLLAVPRKGVVRPIATRAEEEPIRFADDVEVTSDGIMWFTDASARFSYADWKLDILESSATGRLLVLHPGAVAGRAVMKGLCFPNGVALDPDEQYVVVAETCRYRLIRRWIDGPRRGEDDVLIDGLPGFPDGVTADAQGRFWVALASPRKAIVDLSAGWPRVRALIGALPTRVMPAPSPTAWVIAVDGSGRVVVDLHESPGAATSLPGMTFSLITSAEPHGDRLWLGSLGGSMIGSIPLP